MTVQFRDQEPHYSTCSQSFPSLPHSSICSLVGGKSPPFDLHVYLCWGCSDQISGEQTNVATENVCPLRWVGLSFWTRMNVMFLEKMYWIQTL